MQKFKIFYIHAPIFSQTNNSVIFRYSFDATQIFEEKIFLSQDISFRKDIDTEIANSLLSHIAIAFGISYYKLCPTKDIIVDFMTLDNFQEKYWNEFYIGGLGEFFYTNNIDFHSLCKFSSGSDKKIEKLDFTLSNNTLLPIGGGKDSIVSSLLLGETDNTPFIFGKIDTVKQGFLDIYGKQELLIRRELDPKLFKMNQEGYYNGHVPITGLISFFMVFICYIYDYKNIIFSNEKSADIGNTNFGGKEINHQYSKSEDFRKNFTQYISEYISTEISYISLLGEYYEIEIAKIFAERGKKYFSVFSSCNKNFSILKSTPTRWCNNCSKCLFVYIILRPFITGEETFEIFGEELYENKKLVELFGELIGITGIKPFECVGEVEEAQLGAYMSLEKFSNILPYLLQYFQEHQKDIGDSQYFSNLKIKYNV